MMAIHVPTPTKDELITFPIRAGKVCRSDTFFGDTFEIKGNVGNHSFTRKVNECHKHPHYWHMIECDTYIRNSIGFAVVDDYGFLAPINVGRFMKLPHFWRDLKSEI